jgi:hypothetical protein
MEVSGISRHMLRRRFHVKTRENGSITARSTNIKQSTISGNTSSSLTKHTWILLPRHRAVFYESRERVRTLRIYRKEGRKPG